MKLILNLPKYIFLLSLVILASQTVVAQTADSYFHDGAQTFIGNDLPGAITKVQEGLNRFPNDPKLNELFQKLLEEQEKQQQQQQNQQNQDQQEQNQEQEQQQQDQEQQNNEQEQQDQQEQNQDEENQEQEQQQQQAQPEELGEMSKEDAQKILQALAQKEKELLKEFKKQKPKGSATHDKDW